MATVIGGMPYSGLPCANYKSSGPRLGYISWSRLASAGVDQPQPLKRLAEPGRTVNLVMNMPTAAKKNGMSTTQLLRAVGQLSWDDFQEFMNRALAMQPAPPSSPRLSRRETDLLLKINAGPPPQLQRACTKLIEKRRQGRLAAQEQTQLLRLVDKMERYDVKRMEWLTELAVLRKMPLRALIQSLGLKTPEYV